MPSNHTAESMVKRISRVIFKEIMKILLLTFALIVLQNIAVSSRQLKVSPRCKIRPNISCEGIKVSVTFSDGCNPCVCQVYMFHSPVMLCGDHWQCTEPKSKVDIEFCERQLQHIKTIIKEAKFWKRRLNLTVLWIKRKKDAFAIIKSKVSSSVILHFIFQTSYQMHRGGEVVALENQQLSMWNFSFEILFSSRHCVAILTSMRPKIKIVPLFFFSYRPIYIKPY